MTISRFRTSLALALAFVMTCTLTPAPLLAAGGVAVFTGQVLHQDGKSPQAGVTVLLVDLVDGRPEARFKSAPTGEDGSFRIEGAPAGTYSLLVDTADGTFLAAESLILTAGVNPRQSLTLSRGPQASTGAGQSLAGVTWGQWLIAGAIVVAAAAVANEVTDNPEEPASPF